MVGSIIVSYFIAAEFAAVTWAAIGIVGQFAVTLIASSIISKAFAPNIDNNAINAINPGNPQQQPPASDNKLPIVYGTGWVGGVVTDLSITTNNQVMYYILALSECTGSTTSTIVSARSYIVSSLGSTTLAQWQALFSGLTSVPIVNQTILATASGTLAGGALVDEDIVSFGDIFFGGKKCVFYSGTSSFTASCTGTLLIASQRLKVGMTVYSASGISLGQVTTIVLQIDSNNRYIVSIGGNYASQTMYTKDDTRVSGLLDQSTGLTDTSVDGYLNIYLYRNGSLTPFNSTLSAISVMQDTNLVYKWDATKLMTNCAFAIVKITYNQNAGLTGLQPTKFQIINSRGSPGDCFLDYLTSTTYGAAIPLSGVDTASLTALNVYSNQTMTFTPYTGGTATQKRFEFDGVIDANQTIMNNLQIMASCCDCLLRYNEITGLWGVIVQQPTYTVAMDLDDSNIISSIQVTPIDIASSYNIAEVKFVDGTQQDSFVTSTFNLAVLNPSLLYPNEPVNKQVISLPLVNNSVQAQYLANRFLEGAREDLQVKCKVNYVGLQLEAGDIVTLTNANYGWTAKLFRIGQVVEEFNDDGSITTSLSLMEFNPAVYDDLNVTQFTPAPNTGIGNPLNFGTITAPVVVSSSPSAATPSISLSVTASSAGIVQYAEVWYSVYANPSPSQRIFAGTTAISSDGNPYTPSAIIGTVTLTNIAQGDWYFFVQMVNGLGKSNFSDASAVLQWRPTTFQYVNRYINVRYGSSITGTGFSTSPRGLTYYGLQNTTTTTGSTNASDYTWYLAPTAFGSVDPLNYLLFSNRGNRKFSFDVGTAAQANSTGAFVPTLTSVYDATLWSGLPDGINSIDLDSRTGQLTTVGTTSVSSANGLLNVTNNTSGSMVVSLAQFLNFGAGVYSKTAAVSNLTIDIYGRVIGFTSPDAFYYTETVFTATASQTTFSVTHTVGDVLVFKNGVLLDLTEYSETSTTVVLATACTAGEIIVVINARAVSTSDYYETNNITIASSTSNTITYSGLPFQNIVSGNLLCFANTGTPTTYTVQSINTTTKVITFTTTISGATAGLTVYRFRAAGSTYHPWSRYTQSVTLVSTLTPTTWAVNNGYEEIFVNGSQFNEIDYDISSGTLTGFPAAVTGNFTVVQWNQNNLGVPCSNIINTVAYSVASQLAYTYASNPLAMEVYANGVLLAKGSGYDYTATSTNWILSTAFPDNITLLNQQTFARDGAA